MAQHLRAILLLRELLWCLTTISNSISMRSAALFWPLQASVHTWYTSHSYRHTHAHLKKKPFKKQPKI